MTNEDILRSAMEQSAEDLGCTAIILIRCQRRIRLLLQTFWNWSHCNRNWVTSNSGNSWGYGFCI